MRASHVEAAKAKLARIAEPFEVCRSGIECGRRRRIDFVEWRVESRECARERRNPGLIREVQEPREVPPGVQTWGERVLRRGFTGKKRVGGAIEDVRGSVQREPVHDSVA